MELLVVVRYYLSNRGYYMPIELLEKDVLTIPPAPQVVAPLMWIDSMNFHFAGPTAEGNMSLRYYPMTAEGKVIRTVDGVDQSKNIYTNTFYADKDACPELDAAFQAVIVAVPAFGKMLEKRAADLAALQKAAEDARKAAEAAAEAARNG
jgi:hypothetical protein